MTHNFSSRETKYEQPNSPLFCMSNAMTTSSSASTSSKAPIESPLGLEFGRVEGRIACRRSRGDATETTGCLDGRLTEFLRPLDDDLAVEEVLVRLRSAPIAGSDLRKTNTANKKVLKIEAVEDNGEEALNQCMGCGDHCCLDDVRFEIDDIHIPEGLPDTLSWKLRNLSSQRKFSRSVILGTTTLRG